MDDDLRLELTPLCELALNKYNAENQGAKFVLADIVKTTWRPGGIFYITLQQSYYNFPGPCTEVAT
ncbi:hypothetical protein A2U01_0008837 [Trifolium medium]|uniref:Uncharacterized protein n=1 Tax=Trifolium medium TaxID=97028 RepID=A0A392MKA8_9FABA|nr:hypothetical protein [Trifolium medium]